MVKLVLRDRAGLAARCVVLFALLAACDDTDISEPGQESDGGQGASDAGTVAPDGGEDAAPEGSADAGEPGTDRFVGVNDVSYLFPLPAEGEQDSLLKLDAMAAHGELLPRALFAEHIDHLWEGPMSEQSYEMARITALRLDPCAGETAFESTERCTAEVRLSAQPGVTGSMIDAAIHLIYRVPQDELRTMLESLLALKQGAALDVSTLPLGPHPIMVQEGLAGPFARGVQKVILEHVGAERLVKLTFMDRGRNSSNWRLHLFERQGQALVAANIPALGSEPDVQQGVDENGSLDTRLTSVHPVDDSVGFPANLLDSEQAKNLTVGEKRAALARLTSFEDPARFSSLTLDCGSCHVNTNAREFYERVFGLEAEQTFAAPPGQNVTRVDQTELASNVLLSFGYFGDRLVVSQRVIHESARVADWFTRGVF